MGSHTGSVKLLWDALRRKGILKAGEGEGCGFKKDRGEGGLKEGPERSGFLLQLGPLSEAGIHRHVSKE